MPTISIVFGYQRDFLLPAGSAPAARLLGLAVKEAVGAGAGGGGGGVVGGGVFLPQALTIRTTASAIVILLHSLRVRFNFLLHFIARALAAV
jgi:hypothetical protein